MKTLEDIKKEYESYEKKTDVVTNLDEFLSFIEIGIDDTDEYQQDYEKELKENKRWKLEAQIRNFFFFIFAEEEVDLYDEDTSILKDCISYTEKMREFYKRIQSVATEENFDELTRLVDFSCDYYYAQTDYYDYLRDKLELISKGIQLYNPRYEDSRVPFTKFMEEKIKGFERKKQTQETPPQYIKGR